MVGPEKPMCGRGGWAGEVTPGRGLRGRRGSPDRNADLVPTPAARLPSEPASAVAAPGPPTLFLGQPAPSD